MRFDAEEAEALAAALTPPRRAGMVETAQAAARLDALLGEAEYHVSTVAVAGGAEGAPPPVAFAFTAAVAGLLLELCDRAGLSAGPRELAFACTVLVVVGLLERRVQRGTWRAASRLALRATDPRSKGAPTRLVLVSALETPVPPSTRRLGYAITVFQVLWLALLWVPCVLGDARAWLAGTGPELLATLGLLALLPGLDPWTRRPRPYPGDNRSGPALAVAVARSWPRSLADRIALEVRLEPPVEMDLDPPRGPSPRTLVVVLASPGVGRQLAVAGDGPVANLAATAARELWLPTTRVTQGPAARLADQVGESLGGQAVVVTADGPPRPDGQPDPLLLQATVQLVHEMALRWSRPTTT